MALDQDNRLTGGLDLGTDPAKTTRLQLADGVRFLEAGALHSRNGRVRAGLEFPSEGSAIDNARIGLYGANVDVTDPYVETIPFMQAVDRVRGFTPYYDQRLEMRGVVNPPDIPQRLNFVYKTLSTFLFNNEAAGSRYIEGDGFFFDPHSRAKFAVYRDRIFIADKGTAPKIFQRRPLAEQAVLKRPLYDIRRMGIVWPTDSAQKPVATFLNVAGAATPHQPAAGIYRFRIILENKNGTQSNPSMQTTVVYPADAILATTHDEFRVDWSTIISTFPGGANAISKVRVYVQYTAFNSEALEPSSYLFLRSVIPTFRDVVTDNLGSIRVTASELQSLSTNHIMPLAQGAPPRLLDIAVSNDVMYGIAAVDEVYREVPVSEGERTVVAEGVLPERLWRPVAIRYKLYDNTIIKAQPTTSQYVFVSNPGQPEYMETWYVVGSGSEFCVGLAAVGNVCIIFTNQGIYALNSQAEELKRVHSKVGCLSRDSIVETEQGIRFLGSDGIPRIFNGATVDEISNELLPIFDREDYDGDYVLRFDTANAQECQGTYGDRKFFFTFPVASPVGLFKPGVTIDDNPQRFLAIGDASRGPTAWTIDRPGGYEIVYWLGRESRLLGIDTGGSFYFMEEGFVDQQPEVDNPVYFDMKFRKFASAQGLQGQFYRVQIDSNTRGETLSIEFQVDDVPALIHTGTFSTALRDESKFYLPAKFKGRYLDVRIFGTVSGRVAVYGATIELAPRGVF